MIDSLGLGLGQRHATLYVDFSWLRVARIDFYLLGYAVELS